ncbi:MAG: type II toxin-antitoxin system RelE/ParE family toxin [Magnetococcus sp. YQC-3]
MKKLNLSIKAKKFLDSLDSKQFKQIVNKIFSLMENTEPHDSKKLKGYSYLRVDTGEYRIIYYYDVDILYVVLIGKRNDADVFKKMF